MDQDNVDYCVEKYREWIYGLRSYRSLIDEITDVNIEMSRQNPQSDLDVALHLRFRDKIRSICPVDVIRCVDTMRFVDPKKKPARKIDMSGIKFVAPIVPLIPIVSPLDEEPFDLSCMDDL